MHGDDSRSGRGPGACGVARRRRRLALCACRVPRLQGDAVPDRRAVLQARVTAAAIARPVRHAGDAPHAQRLRADGRLQTDPPRATRLLASRRERRLRQRRFPPAWASIQRPAWALPTRDGAARRLRGTYAARPREGARPRPSDADDAALLPEHRAKLAGWDLRLAPPRSHADGRRSSRRTLRLRSANPLTRRRAAALLSLVYLIVPSTARANG